MSGRQGFLPASSGSLAAGTQGSRSRPRAGFPSSPSTGDTADLGCGSALRSEASPSGPGCLGNLGWKGQPRSCGQGLAGASSPRLRCGLPGPPARLTLHACSNPDACLQTAAVALEPRGRSWARSPQAALASVRLQRDWLLMAAGKHPAQGPSGEGRQLQPQSTQPSDPAGESCKVAKSLPHVWRLRVWTGARSARRLSASPLHWRGQPSPRGPPPQPQGWPWPPKAPFSRCQGWGRPRCRSAQRAVKSQVWRKSRLLTEGVAS